MPFRLRHRRFAAVLAVLFAALLAANGSVAQQPSPRIYTTADYARAESRLAAGTTPLVDHTVTRPVWLDDGRLWFSDTLRGDETYMLADPARRTKAPAFDHIRLAAALTTASPVHRTYDSKRLNLTALGFTDNDSTLDVTTREGKFHCGVSNYNCSFDPSASAEVTRGRRRGGEGAGPTREPAVLSPDGTHAAFIRDWNLWMRDPKTNAETQLTTDGVENYGYATDNAGWTRSDRAILVWSPDSKRIATFQQDQRKTGDMYLVSVTDHHPTLTAWKYPLVGDKDVTMIERVIIDVPEADGQAKVTRLKMPPDQHRSTLCDDISCKGGWEDVQWSDDSRQLAFVSTSRNHQVEILRLANPDTGDVREVFTESVPTFFESGNGAVNWRYLSASNEFLWFSERDNWGQMYLYDATTGKLKNQITTGDGNVTQVLNVNEKARVLTFLAVGKERGRDPYFSALYRIRFDGKDMKLLTPENADHLVTLSKDARSFVDIYSTIQTPQVSVLRDTANGKVLVELARQDISRLTATGWHPPEPITVKGRDGKTDIYGFLWKPYNFDATKKYPIINHIYPGPQTGSCGSRSFSAASGDTQALAELGFVVVCLDGMGTPWRSKSFHAAYYGNMGDNTLPDQVAGMKELIARDPWIDAERVGIYGHSGGGDATAGAMFHYPDFFKVGIAESGNHDNREYEDDWGEKWQGLEIVAPDGTSNYDHQANENFAANLKGKLLLAHGTADNNVPTNNTYLVADALIKANKDFDLLLLPNRAHGYGDDANYMMRRRWDYFVQNLAAGIPPKEYRIGAPPAARIP
jgi:dipeptidyl-peptidase-4